MTTPRHCWTCKHCPKPGECRGFTLNRTADAARELWVARTHPRGAKMPSMSDDGGGCPSWRGRTVEIPEQLHGEFRAVVHTEEDRYAQHFMEQQP